MIITSTNPSTNRRLENDGCQLQSQQQAVSKPSARYRSQSSRVYPLDTIRKFPNYCSDYCSESHHSFRCDFEAKSNLNQNNNNDSRSTLVTFECDPHTYLGHSRENIKDSEQLEQLATEWLEISRTLTENENLLNEMLIDLAAKELIRVHRSDVFGQNDSDSSNSLLLAEDDSLRLGPHVVQSCTKAPSSNNRARRSYSLVSHSCSSSTPSSSSSSSHSFSTCFNTSISSFETGASSSFFTEESTSQNFPQFYSNHPHSLKRARTFQNDTAKWPRNPNCYYWDHYGSKFHSNTQNSEIDLNRKTESFTDRAEEIDNNFYDFYLESELVPDLSVELLQELPFELSPELPIELPQETSPNLPKEFLSEFTIELSKELSQELLPELTPEILREFRLKLLQEFLQNLPQELPIEFAPELSVELPAELPQESSPELTSELSVDNVTAQLLPFESANIEHAIICSPSLSAGIQECSSVFEDNGYCRTIMRQLLQPQPKPPRANAQLVSIISSYYHYSGYYSTCSVVDSGGDDGDDEDDERLLCKLWWPPESGLMVAPVDRLTGVSAAATTTTSRTTATTRIATTSATKQNHKDSGDATGKNQCATTTIDKITDSGLADKILIEEDASKPLTVAASKDKLAAQSPVLVPLLLVASPCSYCNAQIAASFFHYHSSGTFSFPIDSVDGFTTRLAVVIGDAATAATTTKTSITENNHINSVLEEAATESISTNITLAQEEEEEEYSGCCLHCCCIGSGTRIGVGCSGGGGGSIASVLLACFSKKQHQQQQQPNQSKYRTSPTPETLFCHSIIIIANFTESSSNSVEVAEYSTPNLKQNFMVGVNVKARKTKETIITTTTTTSTKTESLLLTTRVIRRRRSGSKRRRTTIRNRRRRTRRKRSSTLICLCCAADSGLYSTRFWSSSIIIIIIINVQFGSSIDTDQNHANQNHPRIQFIIRPEFSTASSILFHSGVIIINRILLKPNSSHPNIRNLLSNFHLLFCPCCCNHHQHNYRHKWCKFCDCQSCDESPANNSRLASTKSYVSRQRLSFDQIVKDHFERKTSCVESLVNCKECSNEQSHPKSSQVRKHEKEKDAEPETIDVFEKSGNVNANANSLGTPTSANTQLLEVSQPQFSIHIAGPHQTFQILPLKLFQSIFPVEPSSSSSYPCSSSLNSHLKSIGLNLVHQPEFHDSSNWNTTIALPVPSINLYHRQHRHNKSQQSASSSNVNNNDNDDESSYNHHHRNNLKFQTNSLSEKNNCSSSLSSTLKSSTAIFDRLRALTQLLLMSHTLKEALDEFSDSSNPPTCATVTEAGSTSKTAPFPIEQVRQDASSNVCSSTSSCSPLPPSSSTSSYISQVNPSSSAPQTYSWTSCGVDSPPAVAKTAAHDPIPNELLNEMDTTDNLVSMHLEQPRLGPIELKCELKSPSHSPSPPTSPSSHGSRPGPRSISICSNTTKSASDPPTVTRSSSSAASASPSAEYLAHHRPSCPNSSIQFLDQLQHLDDLRQSASGTGGGQLTIPKVPSMAHPSSTPSLSTAVSPPPPLLPPVPDPPPPKPCNLRRPNSFARLSSSFNSPVKGQHYLKYPTKKVRGPYAEMLESMMRPSSQLNSEGYDCPPEELSDNLPMGHRRPSPRLQTISFTDELLRQTKKQRNDCEHYSKEGFGTNDRAQPGNSNGHSNEIRQDADTSDNSNLQQTETANQPNLDEQNVVSGESKQLSVEQINSDDPPKEESSGVDQTILTKTSDDPTPISPKTDVPAAVPEEEPTKVIKEKKDKKIKKKSIVLLDNNSAGQSQDADRSITAAIGRHLDTRAHIVGELYDTEKTYCDVLRALFETYLAKYIGPNAEHPTGTTTSNVIKWLEFIGQLMPAVIEIHSKFLEQLRRRIADWSPDQTKIANLFDCFDNRPLVDFYLAMVDHLNDIRAILKHHTQLCSTKDAPSAKSGGNAAASAAAGAARAQETPAAAQRRKFTLDDLLISIIQRIPRYKLLLTRLIKYTNEDHEDYAALKLTLNKIHNLLTNMGTNQNGQPGSEMATKSESFNESSAPCASVWYSGAQTVDTSLRQLYVRDLEAVMEGAQNLLDQYPPTALVHIYEYVVIRKRERVLFVLDDCIFLCQNKSKKKSDKFEYNKFKVLQIINMENVVLRCQCWQHRYPGANGPNQSSSSQASDSPTFCTSLGCVSCIETLEYDLKSLLKMQTNVQSIYTVLIRNTLESTLTEQLQTVYNQLVEMHETIARCSKDNNVDLYILTENDRELPNMDLLSPSSGTATVNISSSSAVNAGSTASSSSSNGSTITAISTSQHHSSSINPKPVRIVHFKCPQHQPTSLSGEPELSINFSCVKKRLEFETIVTNLRAQIVKSRLKLEFLCALPYQKTRAGLQFTCVSPTIGTNDVWICKSDGFVGQISVLSINNLDEPTVISCNGVCNAQIVCLSAVPPALNSKQTNKSDCRESSECASSSTSKPLALSSSNSSASSSSSSLLATLGNRNSNQQQQQQQPGHTLRANHSWSLHQHHAGDSIEETDASENESDAVQRHSSSKSSDFSGHQHHSQHHSPQHPHQHHSSPSPSKTTTLLHHLKSKGSKSKTAQNTAPPPPPPPSSQATTTGTAGGWHSSTVAQLAVPAISMASISVDNIIRDDPGSNGGSESNHHHSEQFATSNSNSSSQASIASISPDCPTMWFGTDDSTIYIYSCYDAVRIGKNKAKVTLNAKVESIQYFKERVFVGLANRTVAVFTRDSVTGFWQTTPTIVENVHCYRFCVVNQDFLWTTSLNVVQIRNEDLQKLDEPIHVDELDEISFIISNQFSIFLTSQNSSYIYRYSPIAPYQRLGTISTGPFVDKALALSEDIIRHHKNACLKISAMHLVQDRIWIGTSAGVILILDNKNTIEIIPNGHTGHVRFITSIKLKDGKLIVVSGGDGYEQFSPGTGSNLAGPTDLFHFMSYCSNLALNLLGRSSSNSNVTTTLNSGCGAANSTSATSGGGGTTSVGSGLTMGSSASSAGIGMNNCASGSLTSPKSGIAPSPIGNPGNLGTGSGVASGTGSTESDNDITPTSSESATLSRNISRFGINSGSEDSKSHLLLWKL